MPKLVDAALQRREIRRAARAVFARRGLRGTGLAHVARAAGMSRSSLYHYYPDKDALVRALLGELLEEEAALFAAALAAAGSPLERIERLARALVASFGDWTALGRLLFDLRSVEARRFRPLFRRLRARLAALLREGQQCGEIAAGLDAELAAAVALGAVDGLLLQSVVDPGAFPDRRALEETLVRVLRRSLAP